KEEGASFFVLQTLGDIYPATSVRSMTLPKFDNARVVAGFPLALDTDEQAQSVDILRMLCPNPEASYLIKVRGDSMIDAGISDGDIIIVDKSNRTPSEHEVAVCEYNGEYTIKHIVQQAGKTWLVPANPKYPRIEIFEEDDFSVWGVVTYTIHKPRS
ncbi:MAG: translesion error-prone DNA polymerase V autoproteolytic subunit, partial [Alloprevotella tannerae]|nr:translesion error-prone DNA polymerase V autoproteolytic subunit [Alloprevotella tannerae]